MRRDLIHARYLQASPGRLRVHGNGARDRLTRTPALAPAEITYEVVRTRDHSVLVRRESHLGLLTPQTYTDVVWLGVGEVQLTSLVDGGGAGTSDEAPPGMQPIPSHLLLVVRDADQRIICSEEILHHMELNEQP